MSFPNSNNEETGSISKVQDKFKGLARPASEVIIAGKKIVLDPFHGSLGSSKSSNKNSREER